MSKLNNFLMFITKAENIEEAIAIIKMMARKILPSFLLGIILGSLVLICVSDQRQKIGVVNINGIIDEFVKTQAKSGQGYAELRKSVQVFGTRLEKVMHDLSNKKSIVLMPAEAVIAGAKDYTLEVQKLLPLVPASNIAQIQPPNEVQAQAPKDPMLDHLKQKIEQENQQQSNDVKVQPLPIQPTNSEASSRLDAKFAPLSSLHEEKLNLQPQNTTQPLSLDDKGKQVEIKLNEPADKKTN